MVKGYWVWVSRDPSVEEVIREIGDPKIYEEIGLCGYGEPTLRFSALKEIAKWVKKRSLWFRGLVENCVVYGDRGYRGCEGVIVCDSKDMRAKGRWWMVF